MEELFKSAMRILFIKLRHIGDSLLLTPTIAATKQKYPHAEIWVLVRESCDGILAGCPEINRILTTANPDSTKRSKRGWLSDLKLAALLRQTHFDFVFELTDNDRARFFAIAARTPMRCTNEHRSLKKFWRPFFHQISTASRWRQHQVVRDYLCPQAVLQLPVNPPGLVSRKEKMVPWIAQSLPEKFCVIHLHTRWERKSWPLARWEELIAGLLPIIPKVVFSCGPGTEEREQSLALIENTGSQVVSTLGKASWPELAWLLDRAAFFVGVDTAAMHLAAAVKCPSVVLFGSSPVHEYHPWQARHWMLRPQDWLGDEEASRIPREKLMTEIPVNRV
ncbi:MAG: glycosyltransferase family 9 protein, partial [Terrimicrobiaceae bacterium]